MPDKRPNESRPPHWFVKLGEEVRRQTQLEKEARGEEEDGPVVVQFLLSPELGLEFREWEQEGVRLLEDACEQLRGEAEEYRVRVERLQPDAELGRRRRAASQRGGEERRKRREESRPPEVVFEEVAAYIASRRRTVSLWEACGAVAKRYGVHPRTIYNDVKRAGGDA